MVVTTTTNLEKKLISQAIEVLRETKNHNEKSEKKALFEDDGSTLYLQVLLKKIPKRNGTQMIKVNLPHSLLKDTDEVCLITGDTNKSDRKAETEPDVLHYKALLDKHGVTQVSKIVTLRQLRTDYKPYADKQKLLAAYDLFLADNKIYECLPRVLGKFFFKKRKFPLKINMKSSNLKQQIEKALSIKRFYVTGNGNSCCSEVATLDMSNSEILANVMEMINAVSKEMPGSWDNIMGLYLKTARSQSIPMYVSYDNPNDIILPKEEKEDDVVIDELSTRYKMSVKVHNDGRVNIFKSKRTKKVCFDEIRSSSPEKNKKKSQQSELKGDNIEIKETSQDSSTKKSKKGKKNVSANSYETPLIAGDDIEIKEISQGNSTKKSKKGKKKLSEDSNETPSISGNDIAIKEVLQGDSSKKSKIGKKNISEASNETPLITGNNIAIKEISQSGSTKKSKKGKKNVSKDSYETSLISEDLPEEKKKSTFKRKREQVEFASKEKKPFLSFESPKQNTKKRKVDSENLKKQQHLKNARKKILQQKTKKSLKV